MIDAAITEALEAELGGQAEQSDEFKRRFRDLVELVLSANYTDPDVRRVMELLKVKVEVED